MFYLKTAGSGRNEKGSVVIMTMVMMLACRRSRDNWCRIEHHLTFLPDGFNSERGVISKKSLCKKLIMGVGLSII